MARAVRTVCILSASIVLAVSPLEARPRESAPTAIDPAIEAKIDALLTRMTLEEKLGQMSQGSKGEGEIPASVEDDVKNGRVGSFFDVADVGRRNALQRMAVEGTRLGRLEVYDGTRCGGSPASPPSSPSASRSRRSRW